MKTAVIAPLGLSPPIVTAGMDSAGVPVSDLVILATENPQVLEGLDLIFVAMSIRLPNVHIHPEILPFDDVNTLEDNFRLMERVRSIIQREREEMGCERILMNIAGGRKTMSITMTLLGQLMDVDSIFHIANKNIALINPALELLRKDITDLHKAETLEKKQEIYLKQEERFNHLLFPPRSDYEIIRMPTFPVDKNYLQRMIRPLREEKIESLPLDDLKKLERHGILEKGKSHYYLTDYGRRLMDVFI